MVNYSNYITSNAFQNSIRKLYKASQIILNIIFKKMNKENQIDELCVNAIRVLSVDMISNAKSGHPGAPIDLAPTAHILFSKYFNFEPGWLNRDRFILSCGHAAPILYVMHHILGGKENPVVSIEELQNYRKMGSRTSGSTEHHVFPEIVECSTGPLGQGIANAIGFSIISLHLQKRFNKPDIELFNNKIWCFCGDGDMMEGVQAEAASIAGHQKLNNLVVFWDNNKVTLSGNTDTAFTEDVLMRYRSYGWHTIVVKNADTDYSSITEAIREAVEDVKDKPVIIDLHTTIGFGSENENSCKMHGTPMNSQQVSKFKEHFGMDAKQSFFVPNEVYEYYKINVRQNRIMKNVNEWNTKIEAYKQKYAKDYQQLVELMEGNNYNIDFFKRVFEKLNLNSSSEENKFVSTRVFSGEVLNAIFESIPGIIVGSPDLTPTTNTAISNQVDFNLDQREGRYIQFGIREHGMQAITNGMACYGFKGIIPFTGTFLAFYNYLLPSIRIAAIDSLRTIIIASHDSIGVGEDGATSQPVECLAQLRSIPNTLVFRPCDKAETCAGYAAAISGPPRPAILVFSRQPTETPVPNSSFDGALHGAYVIRHFNSDDQNGLKIILISTGTEVILTLKAADILKEKGFNVQVVSMPSSLLFDEQSAEYKKMVFPPWSEVLRVSIEASVKFGWCEYSHKHIGVEHFGFSASFQELYKEFGLFPEGIAQKVQEYASAFYHMKES